MANQDASLRRRVTRATEVLAMWRQGETLTPEQVLVAQVGFHAALDRMLSESVMPKDG